jgi:RNA methyltransferase, TrmH family
VCEGPRVIEAALEHGAALVECLVATEATDAARAMSERVAEAGVPVRALAPGVAGRIADTVNTQGLFGIARLVRVDSRGITGATLVVVGARLNDPGNVGTLVRSAAGAGADAVVLGAGSVDAYNPKVVRASAGACFAVRIVEGVPTVEILQALGAAGVRRLGASASDGAPPERFDLTVPTAFVLGHEARGLEAGLPLDGRVTIPMHAAESLNVAMAATGLLFEAARQRRAAS